MMLSLLLLLAGPAQKADDPPVRIDLNHEQFTRGDRARVYVQTAEDGHLVVLHADPEGRIRVLFPLDPSDDDFVRGGRKVEIRSRSDRDAFFVDAGDGSGTVVAVLSPDALSFDAFVRNDHWDYRSLGPTSEDQRSDPLAGLLDVARRMAGESHFEYDVATYVVGDQIASRYGYGSDYYGYDSYGFGSYGFGHPYRYGFGVGFGYPWGYDPFCYDPFWGWSCGARFGGFGYYSPYYYGRPYVYRPYTYRSSGYNGFSRFSGIGRNFGSGSRFVMPRDRAQVRQRGIEPRSRGGFVNPGATPRGSRGIVQPRGSRDRGSVQPRGGSSRGPTMSRPSGGGSRSGGSARGSSGGSRSGGGSRPSNGGGGRRH
jgi:hypothetical protein